MHNEEKFMTVAMRFFMCALLNAATAHAASPFDGNWKGEGKPTGACPDKAEVTFTIKDGEFSAFALIGPRGQTRNIKGSVSDSGSATLEFGTPRNLKGTVAFSGDKFDGKLDTLCGPREFSGSKV